jgi:hypothetical protein
MRYRLLLSSLPLVALSLALAPTALASNTWYVDGVHGNDNNSCKSRQHACKTIWHAISLAHSGDSIMVAAATYTENLIIGFSLKVIGSGASATIIDGGRVNSVVTSRANLTLSRVTIRNGSGGIGGGVVNEGSSSTLTINKSTLSGNLARSGGGIYSLGPGTLVTINNSTLSGNGATFGGGILNGGTLAVSNSTLSGNGSGGIANGKGNATLQNSIVANSSGGNCSGTMTSDGYNLSSDNTCNFSGTGDLNNTDPVLGQLGNYGGPTQTIPLLSGSPAIDAGNPGGCTEGRGHLLKTDQRGKPRPDKEDTGGCDMGAYERQSD